MSNLQTHLGAWIGGAIAIGIGAIDLWRFDKLGTTADTMLLIAGLAAFGVSVAVAATSSATPPK